MKCLCQFLCDSEAATAVEYAVILALILMSVLGAIGAVGAQTGGMWSDIRGQMQGVGFVR